MALLYVASMGIFLPVIFAFDFNMLFHDFNVNFTNFQPNRKIIVLTAKYSTGVYIICILYTPYIRFPLTQLKL